MAVSVILERCGSPCDSDSLGRDSERCRILRRECVVRICDACSCGVGCCGSVCLFAGNGYVAGIARNNSGSFRCRNMAVSVILKRCGSPCDSDSLCCDREISRCRTGIIIVGCRDIDLYGVIARLCRCCRGFRISCTVSAAISYRLNSAAGVARYCRSVCRTAVSPACYRNSGINIGRGNLEVCRIRRTGIIVRAFAYRCINAVFSGFGRRNGCLIGRTVSAGIEECYQTAAGIAVNGCRSDRRTVIYL